MWAKPATCVMRLDANDGPGSLAMVTQDLADRLVVRVPPPEAKWVARWVGIDLVPLGGGQIVGCLQETGTKRDGVGVGARWVVDVKIEMNLLRDSIRPIRRDVVGCELDADHPATVSVDDAVPPVVGEDAAADHPRPEGALGGQVSRIEHDYLSHDLHADILAGRTHR